MKLVDFCREITRQDFKFNCDEDLPKYKKIKASEDFYVKVKADETGFPLPSEFEDSPLAGPGSKPLNYQQEQRRLADIITVSNLREFIKEGNANKFNITISDSLLATAKESRWWSGGIGSSGVLVSGETKTILQDAIKEGDKPGFFKRLFGKKKSQKPAITKTDEEKQPAFSIDITRLFDLIKVESGKEREFIGNIESYVKLIQKAKDLHQTAQLEKLIVMLINHVYESVLSVSKFSHYVTVEELSKLQGQCERTLDIDYIEKFGRIIPDSVAELKKQADELGVFDNYLILHYNPTGEIWKTEEEKRKEEAARRDPILFGVITGSDKLYKIADWIDLYCDLTWDDVISKIQAEEIDLNKEINSIINGDN